MKPKGLLTVVGSLDIKQYWPATKGIRSSDGDTAHMKVDPKTSFIFSTSPAAKPKPTTRFIGTYVNDHGKKTKVITSKNEIKIRFQGIDATELHFPVINSWHPSKKGQHTNEFRQPHAASAANALHNHLKEFVSGGSTLLHATFVTQINRLSEAVDSQGRFVGDIIVGTSAGKSTNTWLVENGWPFPAFYDSMTDTEVQTILKAWDVGRNIGARVGKVFQKVLQLFDPKYEC
jgi:endonuclease YncB( thermonuclease family)